MLTLYHGRRSSGSRRVGLHPARMEHHSSPSCLKLDPNGVIPLLIREDVRYLDETWPEPPMRPADAAAKIGPFKA